MDILLHLRRRYNFRDTVLSAIVSSVAAFIMSPGWIVGRQQQRPAAIISKDYEITRYHYNREPIPQRGYFIRTILIRELKEETSK